MVGAESMSTTHRNMPYFALVFYFSSIGLGLNPEIASADTAGSCTSLRSMARIYMASGRYGKAQPLLERALQMARQESIPDSETCGCMLDLAYLYNNQNRLTAAETMCRSGLALQQKAFPQNHPYIAHTLRILSEIYRRQGRYQEAADALEQAITIVRDVSRGDDRELAPFKVDMARLLLARGDLVHAESYFKEAIEVIEDNYGPEHLYTTKVLASMAELYIRQ
jgi:tetratricopeptide (TPR) repeat protein